MERVLTAEVIEGFCNAALRKNFDNPSPIPDFHRELWTYCCDKARYVAVAAPRG